MKEFLNAIGPWIVGIVFFGGPVALAWWLSDGFTSIEVGPDETLVVPAINPYTQKAGNAVVSKITGAPVAYID